MAVFQQNAVTAKIPTFYVGFWGPWKGIFLRQLLVYISDHYIATTVASLSTHSSVCSVLFAWWHESSCKSFRPVDDVMCKSFSTSSFLQSYFKDSWNTFDFVTVVGSIVDALMVEFAVSKKHPFFTLDSTISCSSCSFIIWWWWAFLGLHFGWARECLPFCHHQRSSTTPQPPLSSH